MHSNISSAFILDAKVMMKKKDVTNLDNNGAISAFLCKSREIIFLALISIFLCVDPAFNSSVPIKLSSRICLTHRIFIPFYLMDGQHTTRTTTILLLD